MSALEAILCFDGKKVGDLKAIASLGLSDDDWTAVVGFFGHPNLHFQVASTWLVKATLETGEHLPKKTIQALLPATSSFSGWEPKLHVLQSVQFLDLSPQQAKKLFEFSFSCQTDEKLLVRVWAMDVCTRLGIECGMPIEELAKRVFAGLENEKGSMRARARNLLKEFPQLENLR